MPTLDFDDGEKKLDLDRPCERYILRMHPNGDPCIYLGYIGGCEVIMCFPNDGEVYTLIDDVASPAKDEVTVLQLMQNPEKFQHLRSKDGFHLIINNYSDLPRTVLTQNYTADQRLEMAAQKHALFISDNAIENAKKGIAYLVVLGFKPRTVYTDSDPIVHSNVVVKL